MSSVNKAIILGRLGDDPEVRYTKNNTAIANMSVATSERYKADNEWKEKTEWHRVVCFGRTAEICKEYLKKGSLVYFEGPLQTRQWEDKNGQKKYTTEIKGLTMKMLDSKPSGEAKKQQAKQPAVDIDEVDDELPF